jgi:DNA-binding transcriptional LysR family regulator
MILRWSSGGLTSLILVLSAFIPACSQPTSPPPLPTPQNVEVAYPTSLKLFEEALSFCAQGNAGIALLVSEMPAGELSSAGADLVLWFGEPPESAGFSAPLAMEEIVFIVHPANPVRTLSIEEIREFFRGEVQDWDDLADFDEQVTVWAYPEENEIQQVIDDEFLPSERMTASRYLAPDPQAMVQAVSGEPGSIGFLPGAWATDEVAIVEIEQGEEIDLSRSVLALTNNPPGGVVRTLLACLQSPPAQNIIERRYEPWTE